MEYLVEKVKELTSDLFAGSNLVLVELKVFREKGKIKLRFLVDRSEGGIRLDECAQLNGQISQILDNAQFLEESYILEVFSPGLDRPLVCLEDFSRAIGRDIRLFLKDPIKNKTELIAKVDKIDNQNVTFLVEAEDIQIPIDNIIKAKQIL